MNFPIYGRCEDEDLNIVPYNIYILEDWQGHANVEWCGSSYTPVYLYKYIYKGELIYLYDIYKGEFINFFIHDISSGAKKEKLRLTNAEDIADDDEINLYLRARMLCSMDAMWRVMVKLLLQ